MSEFTQKLIYFITTVISLIGNIFIIYYCFFIFNKINFTFEKNKYFFLGIAAAILLIPFLKLLQWVYVLFHEISHAIAVIIFSGKILGFSAKIDLGQVRSDKENIIIRLAPYLIPLLPYLILFIHYILLVYLRNQDKINLMKDNLYFSFFLIGFTYVVITYFNLKLIIKETTDIDTSKLMLSFSLILNFYTFFSVSMLFLLYESSQIVDRYYFLD